MEQTECSVRHLTVVARAASCGMGHGGDRCPDECPEVGAADGTDPANTNTTG